MNARERPRPVYELIFRRVVEDNVPPKYLFDFEGFVRDTGINLLVCGHDGVLFVKHLAKHLSSRRTPSVVIQHGMNRPLLEFPPSVRGVPDLFAPSLEPQFPCLEYLKRRFGYRYGAFPFCNPYIDEVYTIGDFFNDRISRLRKDYPCRGEGKVYTTGSTEYDPAKSASFKARSDTALFLSQWQYEGGQWTDAQQRWIVDTLKSFCKINDIELTVRPHPKGTDEKIQKFFEHTKISRGNSLNDDVESHDVILTVDSTAILEGILEGKMCGVLQPPWNPTSFPPFTHDHILQISDGNIELNGRIESLSNDTQQSYLRQFCYVPNNNDRSVFDSPTEVVTTKIEKILK